MPIKSFRGLIADGAQDTITLHTNTGSTGYRIVKFEVMPNKFGSAGTSYESVVKIYKISQSTIDGAVDFSDNTLLAAAALGGNADMSIYNTTPVIVFDNEIFNQDIYITHTEKTGIESMNYYIELEQITLDLTENTVATLKDIRNIASQ